MQLGVIFLFLFLLTDMNHGSKILLLPFSVFGHIRQLAFIGGELVERGHDVHLVLPETYKPQTLGFSEGLKYISHQVRHKYVYSMDNEEKVRCFKQAAQGGDIVTLARANNDACFGANYCKNLLEDENLYEQLLKMEFDLVVVGSVPMGRCSLILPYNLGIPYISFTPIFEHWLSRNPALPSHLPSHVFKTAHTEKMDFWQRLQNAWSAIDWVAFPGSEVLSDELTHRFIREGRPLISLNEIAHKSLLWLIDQEMLMDYPRPIMPNELYVGGLSLKPAEPLSGVLSQFMDAATDGAIIMTFGSNEFRFEADLLQKFLNAFQKVGLRVIIKNSFRPDHVPDNVLMEKWIPQNDLLAHPNTKAFITHCGNNGVIEATFHGVPLIGFPLFGDQPYNCNRLVYHKFGICLQLRSLGENDLVEALRQVLYNETYRRNSKHVSQIMKEQRSGRVRAADGIEHVLKHGGEHLHSHALDLPWYQYLMLDILLFVVSFLALTVIIIIYLLCWICEKKKKSDKSKKLN